MRCSQSDFLTCADRIFAFDLHPLREVTTNRDGEGLRQLQDAALRLKIRCESDFLRFVFMVLLVGFLHVLFENRRKELTGSNQANLNLHFKALMESNGEFLAATLTSALMTGYSSGDVEKASMELSRAALVLRLPQPRESSYPSDSVFALNSFGCEPRTSEADSRRRLGGPGLPAAF